MLGKALLLQHQLFRHRLRDTVHADDAGGMLRQVVDAESFRQFRGIVAVTEPFAETGSAVVAGAMAEEIAVRDEAIHTDLDRCLHHPPLDFAPARLVDAGHERLRIDTAATESS